MLLHSNIASCENVIGMMGGGGGGAKIALAQKRTLAQIGCQIRTHSDFKNWIYSCQMAVA